MGHKSSCHGLFGSLFFLHYTKKKKGLCQDLASLSDCMIHNRNWCLGRFCGIGNVPVQSELKIEQNLYVTFFTCGQPRILEPHYQPSNRNLLYL